MLLPIIYDITLVVYFSKGIGKDTGPTDRAPAPFFASKSCFRPRQHLVQVETFLGKSDFWGKESSPKILWKKLCILEMLVVSSQAKKNHWLRFWLIFFGGNGGDVWKLG